MNVLYGSVYVVYMYVVYECVYVVRCIDNKMSTDNEEMVQKGYVDEKESWLIFNLSLDKGNEISMEMFNWMRKRKKKRKTGFEEKERRVEEKEEEKEEKKKKKKRGREREDR